MLARERVSPRVLAAFRRVQQLAARDGLTGLYNRRHILEELDYLRGLCRCRRLPFSVALVDLDGFKAINDTHGHPAGDDVLVELAGLLRGAAARGADVAGRHGGDEFVVVLPGAGAAEARAFGKRLLGEIRAHRFCGRTLDLKLTASMGVVSLRPRAGKSLAAPDILSRADQALYTAKARGGDRVCAWTGKRRAARER